MDIARLGIQIDSSDATTADRRLRRLPAAGREAEQSLTRLQKTSAGMGAAMRGAALQIAGVAGAMLSVQKAFGAAEQYSNMQNRLLSLGASHAEAASQIQSLAEIANSTRTPLEATASLYTRLKVGAQSLGASQDELMQFTENVGLALAASGTSASEASGALTQLSQAMAGGVVRAEEFNSIIEGAPGLLVAVANGMEGVDGDLGKLRQSMLDGELTSKAFFEALLSQSDALETAFGQTAPTISQAMTVLNNSFVEFIGQSDQAFGVTTQIAEAMLLLAENMDVAIPIFGAVGVAIAAVTAPVSLTIAAVGALAFAVITHWGEIKAAFQAGVDFFESIAAEPEKALMDLTLAIARGLDATLDALGSFAEYAVAEFSKVVPMVREFGADLVQALIDMGKDALEAAKGIGLDIVAGLKSGIQQKWQDLRGYVSGLGTGMLDGIKETLRIRSPSREFMEVGRYSVEGLVIGLDDNADKAIDRARHLGEEIGKGVRDGVEPVLKTIFDGISTGDIGSIGSNLLGQAQGAFSGLLQNAFKRGGNFFGNIASGFSDAISGVTSALSTGAGFIGKLGGAISAALPIVGAISTAISFFKTTTTELDAGIRVTTNGMDSLVETFRTLNKVKFFGLSNKTSTSYDYAEMEVADPIQRAVNSIGETVMSLADTIGLASENLAQTSFQFEVSTKDKTDEQIQSAIQAELERLGNVFADAVIGSYTEYLPDEAELARIDEQIAGTYNNDRRGSEYEGARRRADLELQRTAAETAISITHLNDEFSQLQLEGEGSLETLSRVVGELVGLNQTLYLFDQAAIDMSVSGATAASKLVQLAGGLEAFTEKSQFVFENMLTGAAQEARLIEIAGEQLNGTLGALGLSIPQTHTEFMAMLNAADLTTEAGRNTRAALLDVAGAFVTVNGTAQEAADSLSAVTEASLASARQVIENRSSAAQTALSDAESALRAAFDAEQDRVRTSYGLQIEAAQASADAALSQANAAAVSTAERVTLFSSIVDALERAYSDRRVLSAIGQRNQLRNATDFLRGAVASGGTSDLAGLESALDVVADPSSDLFKSFEDYRFDYAVNTALIEKLRTIQGQTLTVEERALRAAEQQVSAISETAGLQILAIEAARDAELSALDSHLDALLGIDNSVMGLAQAMGVFRAAQASAGQNAAPEVDLATEFAAGSFAANLDGIYQDLLGRNVQQAGLDFYGGLFDPENDFGYEDIRRDILQSEERARYLASQGGGSDDATTQLIAEVQQLRASNERTEVLLSTISTDTRRNADVAEEQLQDS